MEGIVVGKFIDMTGWVMSEHGVPDSRLTVIERAEDGVNSDGYPIIRWLCECGCGEHKRIIANSDKVRSGHTKSCGCLKNEKIIKQGHANKKFNKYDLSGEWGIGFTNKGKAFYFDLEDYDKIKDYCWNIDKNGYVTTDIHKPDKRSIKMHRLVMDVKDSSLHVDHINHQANDNRKNNLRICTSSENNWNVEKRIDNKSGCPGVSWHKRDLCWEVHIQVHTKSIYLGRFDNYDDAVTARKQAEEKYFGEYSFDNSQEVATYV